MTVFIRQVEFSITRARSSKIRARWTITVQCPRLASHSPQLFDRTVAHHFREPTIGSISQHKNGPHRHLLPTACLAPLVSMTSVVLQPHLSPLNRVVRCLGVRTDLVCSVHYWRHLKASMCQDLACTPTIPTSITIRKCKCCFSYSKPEGQKQDSLLQ